MAAEGWLARCMQMEGDMDLIVSEIEKEFPGLKEVFDAFNPNACGNMDRMPIPGERRSELAEPSHENTLGENSCWKVIVESARHNFVRSPTWKQMPTPPLSSPDHYKWIEWTRKVGDVCTYTFDIDVLPEVYPELDAFEEAYHAYMVARVNQYRKKTGRWETLHKLVGIDSARLGAIRALPCVKEAADAYWIACADAHKDPETARRDAGELQALLDKACADSLIEMVGIPVEVPATKSASKS